MERKPIIKTAIPKRRYQLADFTIVILGEIETSDPVHYAYVLAVVKDGDPEPGVYITAEGDNSRPAASEPYSMRVVMRDGAEVIGTSKKWGDLDAFANDALDVILKLFDMEDEKPKRIM